MKRLIVFLLLFAAIKVAGQTTGYLRFDTVRIYKQNGTCELYLINSTKDSLGLLTNIGGGLTRFLKSRAINDSTIVVGLDTLVIRGATGGSASTDTTIVEKPLIVRTGSNDTLALQYHDGLTINNDSTLVVSLRWIDSVRRTSPYLYRMVSVLYNAGIIVIGNSISQTGTTPYETYANMFAKAVGGPYNNYSIPGGDAQILGDMLRNNRLPFGRTQAALYNNHVNVIRFEMSTGVRLWVKNAVRSFLINCFKAQSTDASAMSVAAGSWASFSGLTATPTSKTDCRVTTDVNAELSFTVKDNQPGLFVVFQTNGPGDTDWSDSVGIYRSGGTQLIATVNPNKQAHTRGMPFVVWLPKTDVFSTIRIRNLTGDTLVVDYAGTTALNNNIAPAFVAEITHVATAALQPGIPHSWWDTVNADMRSVVEDEFVAYGYPVAIFDVNSELEYDNPVYFHELLTTPASAIHPSTYAHQNAILPQLLGRVVLRSSEKKSIEYATNVSTYSAGISFQGQEKVIILPSITQNSGLNYAADSFAVAFGQRLTVINDNRNATFNWNAVFWTYLNPDSTTGTSFPNKSVTEMIWTRQGFRVTNRYAVDSVTTSNDTTYIKVNGRQHFFVHQGGGGGGTPAGSDGDVQYNTSGSFDAEAAFNYNETTNKLFAGDTLSAGRVVSDQIRPLTTNTFGVRSISGNAIALNLQSSSNTNLLSFASDASASTTITASTGPLTIFSGSGQQLRLIASGGVSLNLLGTGLVGLNETSPAHRFQSFENAPGLTADRRAIYGINQATYNATAAARISAGVFGFDNSTRASGSNTVTNVGVYGLGQAGGQLTYGMVSEAMTSTTNAVVPSMRIISNSTGTVTNGFGTSLFLGSENSVAANINVAEMQAVSTDVNSTSEDFDLVFRTIRAGSLAESFRITSTGAVRYNNAYTFPSTAGTNGQVLQTDGSGNVTWQTVGGGGSVSSVGLVTGTTGTDIGVSGSPITSSGDITLNIPTASASNRGALSSTDWSTFNNKLSNITSLISAGTNVSLTGTGASGDPYVISSSTGDLVIVNDANHTVTSTQSAVRYQNNITANRTVTLPDPGGVAGREIWVKWNTIDGGAQLNITTTSGTALIYFDGTSGSTSPPSNVSFLSMLLKSDGTSWYKIN